MCVIITSTKGSAAMESCTYIIASHYLYTYNAINNIAESCTMSRWRNTEVR